MEGAQTMRLIGMMCCRNEDWCLGLTLRVALMWCDEVIVCLHACTDDSLKIAREIYDEFPGRLGFFHDQDPTWNEMRHRQTLLKVARRRGATHLAITDADEILTGNLLSEVANEVARSGIRDKSLLQLPGYNLRG